MRRISIDTLGLMSLKSSARFEVVKRRSVWSSAPRLLTTCILFCALWLWFNIGTSEVLMPQDSFAYVQDENLRDILNTTLGFGKILVLNLPFRTDRGDAMSLSAAISNFKLEFVEGVTGGSINEKAYPPPEENRKYSAGIRGSWRTHMNALQSVVDQNLTTALILEDDVDWDIRIRPNLQRFALASRFLSGNYEMSTLKDKLQTHTNTETKDTAFKIIDTSNLAKTLTSLPLSSVPSSHSITSQTSPYGDPTEWDILWLGHCGTGMPRPAPNAQSHRRQSPTSTTILTHANDPTVPSPPHLKAHPFQGDPDALATTFPPHTRIYHHATGGTLCTVSYAVSQRGARRLLHQFSVSGWNGIFDSELGRWCAGNDPDMGRQAPQRSPTATATGGGGVGVDGDERVCVTVQPPVFAHHHPYDGESDIRGLGGGYAKSYETKYLRYSVRMNLGFLVRKTGREGEVEGLVDQWPDGGGSEGSAGDSSRR